MLRKLALITIVSLFAPIIVNAEEYRVEVMTLEGSATIVAQGISRPLAEGDILAPGDKVEVAAGGHADLAFDADWKNVARVDGGSSAEIISVIPGGIYLQKGSIFAELGQLPSGSTFEIETPTAVAAVRGSTYQTAFDGTSTEVQNFADSKVNVFSLDDSGEIFGAPLLLNVSEKTRIEGRGRGPLNPVRMNDAEVAGGRTKHEILGGRIENLRQLGKRGKIQDLKLVGQGLPHKGLKHRELRGANRMDGNAGHVRQKQGRKNRQHKRDGFNNPLKSPDGGDGVTNNPPAGGNT